MGINNTPLGMNARNFLYINKYNTVSKKKIADDKVETKKILIQNNLPTSKLFFSINKREDIEKLNWSILPENGFVIKPIRGYGGEGILLIKSCQNEKYQSITGEIYDKKQIYSHIFDILEGAYSLNFLPDGVLFEERILPHAFFKRLGAIGIPDIRIIVFNSIPIMAMLRFPTKESKGKANIHQGALGFGIDIRTGITVGATFKGKFIDFIPNTKIKTRGIKIPIWENVLLTATKTQAISGLGYLGVDIVLDNKERPLILEINARPGLAIQNANNDSLRTRLERIENINISSSERGIEVAKSLFTQKFLSKVDLEPKIVSIVQTLILKNKENTLTVNGKLDTTSEYTSIDRKIAKKLNIVYTGEKLEIVTNSGKKIRDVVKLTFILQGKKIQTKVLVFDRSIYKYSINIGRRDLKGFLIKPELYDEV